LNLEPRTVIIGTRGSQLALWQAKHVAERLRESRSGIQVRLEAIRTTGDKILDVPLARVGGKALFVKEIEEALLSGQVDLAVHSMKDVPTELPAGLLIAAVPRREDAGDVLLSRTGARFLDLHQGAVVGTSSLRRQAQLLHHRPDLQVIPLRGNLDTRIRKLDSEGLDAIVLAVAGIRRLGLTHRITEILDPEICLPAVGQGALGIEIRAQGTAHRAQGTEGGGPPNLRTSEPRTGNRDAEISGLIVSLDHRETHLAVFAERSILRRLGGGCQVPIAGHALVEGPVLVLRGLVASPDGRRLIRAERRGPVGDGEVLGAALAEDLLSRGGAEILKGLMREESGAA
jgi:hydroxymethylbilane synthase